MKWALIPLDDRPQTLQFPLEISAMGGIEVESPPREILGSFLVPGDCAALAEWVLNSAADWDGVIIAADMLCFGGLIASRTDRVSLEQAQTNLAVFAQLKKKFPRLRVWVASVIMRISLTASDEQAACYYRALIEYSELKYQVETLCQTEWKQKLDEVVRLIPVPVMTMYERVRKRNHEINKMMISLKEQGVIDELVFLQEDASVYGPHLLEQAYLREMLRDAHLDQDVKIYPGADEGTQTLLARLINQVQKPEIRLIFTSEEGAELPAPYEDRPLRETAVCHAESAGFVVNSDGDAPIVWIHTPAALWETELAVDQIEQLLNDGMVVALADTSHPNGGDSVLMRALQNRNCLPKLTCYAGWSTAGNTFGTVFAQLSARLHMQSDDEESKWKHKVFLWKRIVDDWGYQTCVRPQMEALCYARHLSPLNLGNQWEVVEKEMQAMMEAWVQENAHPAQFGMDVFDFQINLPWSRLFEIAIEAV